MLQRAVQEEVPLKINLCNRKLCFLAARKKYSIEAATLRKLLWKCCFGCCWLSAAPRDKRIISAWIRSLITASEERTFSLNKVYIFSSFKGMIRSSVSPSLLTISSLNSVSRPFRIALKSDITPPGACVHLSKSVCRKSVCASVCLSASRSWEHWWLRGRLAVGCWTDNFLVIIILMKTTEL